MGKLARKMFGMPDLEADFAKRGFVCSSAAVQKHLEHIGHIFLGGYNSALIDAEPCRLSAKLEETESRYRGFAYEGAAMGLALQDFLCPWRRDRWCKFLQGPGRTHIYMMHVGVGWMMARVSFSTNHLARQFVPVLGWLVIDGFGFHEAYFRPRETIVDQCVPRRIRGRERMVFDQGVGRALWFVYGADADLIAAAIAAFPPARQPDLWSGVGLASTYAGGVERSVFERLTYLADANLPALAQGAAFAAKARADAGNLVSDTECGCEVICHTDARTAALVTDICLEGCTDSASRTSYEAWRAKIQMHYRARRTAARSVDLRQNEW
jgi:hypothetical protein